MSFAIFRLQKLKTFGSIGGSLSHNFRARLTLNADESRAHLNHHDHKGSGDCLAAIKARIPEKRRKDAVLCIEHLFTASPDWPGWGTEKEAAFFERARAWLKEKYGEKNVISTSIHRDETTPHLVAYVVPFDEVTGRLNAKKFIGGSRHVLSQMQTDFHSKVKDLELDRGKKNSPAKHQSIKKFYSGVDLAEKKAVVERRALEQKVEIVPPQRGFFEGEASYAERAQAALEEAFKAYTAQAEKKINLLRAEVLQLEREKQKLFDKYNQLLSDTLVFKSFREVAPRKDLDHVEDFLRKRGRELKAEKELKAKRELELIEQRRSAVSAARALELHPSLGELVKLQSEQNRAFLGLNDAAFGAAAKKKYKLMASLVRDLRFSDDIKKIVEYDQRSRQSHFIDQQLVTAVESLRLKSESREVRSFEPAPSPKKDRGFEI